MCEPFPAYNENDSQATSTQDTDAWMSDFVDLSSAPSRPSSQQGTTTSRDPPSHASSLRDRGASMTTSTNSPISRPFSPNPFLGASEPLEDPDPSAPTPHYNNPTFTDLEDETLLLFRTQHPFSSWDHLHTKWLRMYCAPYTSTPSFPARELSALLARWQLLNARACLSPRDCMIVWIHRNSTVPTPYSKLDAAFTRAGKCVGEEVLVEAERYWGRRVGIEGWGYKALRDESVEFALDGRGMEAELEELRGEWWRTMQGQWDREMEIVWRRWNDDWELWQICESYAEKGVRWDEERVRGMVEEMGWEERRKLMLETL